MPKVSPPKRLEKESLELNQRADHFEALLRARFLRAVEELQRKLTPKELTSVFRGRTKRKINKVLLARVEAIFAKHLDDVIEMAYRQGGKMGESRLNKTLRVSRALRG